MFLHDILMPLCGTLLLPVSPPLRRPFATEDISYFA